MPKFGRKDLPEKMVVPPKKMNGNVFFGYLSSCRLGGVGNEGKKACCGSLVKWEEENMGGNEKGCVYICAHIEKVGYFVGIEFPKSLSHARKMMVEIF